MSSQDREWVRPGAEVVVWSSGKSLNARVDKIRSVGKEWITLEELSSRIRIRDLQSARQGTGWGSYTYHIAERNAPEAIKNLSITNVSRRVAQMHKVIERWQNAPLSTSTRQQLATALQNLNLAIDMAKENS